MRQFFKSVNTLTTVYFECANKTKDENLRDFFVDKTKKVRGPFMRVHFRERVGLGEECSESRLHNN